MGDWSSCIVTLHSFAFRFPEREAYVNFGPHLKAGSMTFMYDQGFWAGTTLCRTLPCYVCEDGKGLGIDTFIYHVACCSTVGCNGTPLNNLDIWKIGVWTHPFAAIRYQAQPGHLSLAPSLRDAAAHSGNHVIALVGRLPPELQSMVAQHCPASLLWRLNSAMSRYDVLSSLVDGRAPDSVMVPFASVESWDRQRGLSILGDTRPAGAIKICLDGLGVAVVGVGKAFSPTSKAPWYAVENICRLEDSSIEIKVGWSKGPLAWLPLTTVQGSSLRIHSRAALTLWDTPGPPFGWQHGSRRAPMNRRHGGRQRSSDAEPTRSEQVSLRVMRRSAWAFRSICRF